MKSIEEKIEEVREYLMKATKLLSDIVEERNTENTALDDWMKDRVELWCRVYNEGGMISQDRLHEIWKDMGKDPRGIGGFFVGKGASLSWTPDDRVVLTKNASDAIKAWTGKTINDYAQQYKQ